ncbi:hypothetical protein H4582DRAFT_1306673 [Lactarius indigo]|nr:hypothetical protein H4582DRAFT_1306673 [Lactarius indigo]
MTSTTGRAKYQHTGALRQRHGQWLDSMLSTETIALHVLNTMETITTAPASTLKTITTAPASMTKTITTALVSTTKTAGVDNESGHNSAGIDDEGNQPRTTAAVMKATTTAPTWMVAVVTKAVRAMATRLCSYIILCVAIPIVYLHIIQTLDKPVNHRDR